MKKSTKGAIAAVGAAALLLGGAGSLAFWTASATLGGGEITAGELKLTGADTCATAQWTLDSVGTPPGGTFDPGSDKVVPGDVLTKTCDVTVVAVGTHLSADVTFSNPTATGTELTVTPVGTFTRSGGAEVTQITEADDGEVLTATLKLTVDGANSNNSQGKTIDLSAYAVTLTQTHN